MTNYNALIKENPEIVKACLSMGLMLKDGKPQMCNGKCKDCDISIEKNGNEKNCRERLAEWLNEPAEKFPVGTVVRVSNNGIAWKNAYFIKTNVTTNEFKYLCADFKDAYGKYSVYHSWKFVEKGD